MRVLRLALAVALLANVCHAQPGANTAAAASIVELGVRDNILYARSESGRLYRWNTLNGDTTLLAQKGFVALAPDGSIAVASTALEPRGTRVEVWDLATERLLRARVFTNGAGSFLAIHGVVVLVEYGPPPLSDLYMPTPAMPETPRVDRKLLDPKTDQLTKGWEFEFGDTCRLAPACLRLACMTWQGLSCSDFEHSGWGGSIRLAPEWIPRNDPPPAPLPRIPPKPSIDMPTWWIGESLAWTGDGNRIVFAYARLGGAPECRLERWTAGDGSRAGEGLERLVTGHRRCSIKVLAASQDGNRVVTLEDGPRLVMRRAPRYEAILISMMDTSQARFLPGDSRFVTVHRDGYLRLWDTQTLGLLAKWP